MRGSNFNKYKHFLEDFIADSSVEKSLFGKHVAVSRNYFDNHFREMLLIVEKVRDRACMESVGAKHFCETPAQLVADIEEIIHGK